MNENFSKLRHEQKQEQTTEQHQEQKVEGKEFSSVEEMLRHDAGQVAVPPTIGAKLNESIAKEPKPATSWWKRLFSR